MSSNLSNDIHAALNGLINQFWAGLIQHRSHVTILSALGYDKLAKDMQQRILDEPETIEALQKRLLELDGQIAFQAYAPMLGRDVRGILGNDLQLQEQGLPVLAEAARLAAERSDTATRRLIEDIIVDEEAHLNWLKDEVSLLERLGDPLYLARSAR
ncbi:bacterioferritin [Caulobacter sp. FWC2]|uniref:ferritin-like domain-containing protein n=1 Tax=Caulobacter sp. FWC2 TaxID=69664 RepID=UPI000C153089|nr:ferritin-like domain-containing protein [Caulobacter sp. FWC2]PIB92310.1 bacterioferritin [Caulobacter sp. FWC2]